MVLISNYLLDEKYRHMLNELTQKTFGFDFEGWVTQGCFEGDYIPYSFMADGRIVSNISVNRMTFMQNGQVKNYIQLGTVMTDEGCRRQGLAARLMEVVLEEYENKCDGIYLFGNLDAAGFYRRMGFSETNQYRYFVKDEFCHSETTGERYRPVKQMGDEMKKKYIQAVRTGAYHSSFEQINKYGLQMFYTAGLDNVYYSGDIDCFAVLAHEDDCTVLQSVLGREKVSLKDVLRRIDITNSKCRLGFTPLDDDKAICSSEIYDGGEDYRLFYRGKELEAIEAERLYFPELSHA